jgi:hypothetical protein
MEPYKEMYLPKDSTGYDQVEMYSMDLSSGSIRASKVILQTDKFYVHYTQRFPKKQIEPLSKLTAIKNKLTGRAQQGDIHRKSQGGKELPLCEGRTLNFSMFSKTRPFSVCYVLKTGGQSNGF